MLSETYGDETVDIGYMSQDEAEWLCDGHVDRDCAISESYYWLTNWKGVCGSC